MKMKKNRILFLALLLAGVMICGWISADRGYGKAEAAEVTGTETTDTASADTKVRAVWADYDALWLKVDANGNTKVYYSDKSKKIWYEAKAANDEEYYYIDISWLSNTSKSVINLKGDINDEIVEITFPARESKFKAKYDKVTGEIAFENIPDGIHYFQWRKATSYDWKDAIITTDGKSGSDFKKEIEKFRISGASIYVRLPQTEGLGKEKSATDSTWEFDPGARQSKEIKINITKRAAAPKVTIDGTKLLINTKSTMEYSLEQGKEGSWKPAKDKMTIQELAPYALVASGTTVHPVTILFRIKETGKKAYSKSFVLTIPAQRKKPVITHSQASTAVDAEVTWNFDESKFYLNFKKASKTEPYEYMVVRKGATPDFTKGWKAVTSAKTISISSKTAEEKSTIYIRKKTVKANTKTEFEIASAYETLEVKYNTTSTSATSK